MKSNKLLKIAAVSGAVLVAPMAQARHHHHGFWGGFTGGFVGGLFAPRVWAAPAYPVYSSPWIVQSAPIVVQQPQPIVLQQQVPVQQPVYVNQAQAQPQQPVFLNQAPAPQAQQTFPELKAGETLTVEVKQDGSKVYKITRQEAPVPQQDASRVREN